MSKDLSAKDRIAQLKQQQSVVSSELSQLKNRRLQEVLELVRQELDGIATLKEFIDFALLNGGADQDKHGGNPSRSRKLLPSDSDSDSKFKFDKSKGEPFQLPNPRILNAVYQRQVDES